MNTVTLAGRPFAFTHPPEHKRPRLMRKAERMRAAFEALPDGLKRDKLVEAYGKAVLWRWLKVSTHDRHYIRNHVTAAELNNAICRIWRIEAFKVAV